MPKTSIMCGLLLALVWCSGALADSVNSYVQTLPAFHQPVDLWRSRHGQNLVRPRDRWRSAPSTQALQSCRGCHRAETCLDCHRINGGPDLRKTLPASNPIYLRVTPKPDGPSGESWANCLSCHPQEAAWPGSLRLSRDPGEYLPVDADFPCPGISVLGRQMSLMNLSLKRAECLAGPVRASPLKAEASRWESLLASPLVLTKAEDIALGMQNLERLAENEFSRPALANRERHYLLVLAGPFLGFGLLLAWRASLRAKNQSPKNARVYMTLSMIFLALSLGGATGLYFGPDDLFYPARGLKTEQPFEVRVVFDAVQLNRLLFLTELADRWIKAQPRHSEPVKALARTYQETKSQLLKEVPGYLNGPSWPPALASWALIAKSAAAVKYGRSLASPGQNQGAEVWDDQIAWLFTLPESPLKRAASLIMVKALAESWPRLTETRPLALPAAPAEEPEQTRFGTPPRQTPAQQLMERLLTNLTEPEELASGLIAFGRGLARSGFQEEAARTFGRAYETALYIKDQPLKVSVFLDLYQAWSDLDQAAGVKVLTETLAVAAARDQEKNSLNPWTSARSLAKVSQAWGRVDLPEALTMATDLHGDHEVWLTARAATLTALGTSLGPPALEQYQYLILKPVYQAYAPYLQAFDLKSSAYSSSWLASSALDPGRRLLNPAGPEVSTQEASEELELLARAGGLALRAKSLMKNNHPEEAQAVWRQAWALVQVAGDYQNDLAAARFYQAIGDAVADDQPDWAALAYQKAFEIMRLAD